jgi:hypothetical protein
VVWAIRESGNHALAGIWHEGTDLKQNETSTIKKVVRGQRQYALFAGLNKEGSACGHISENGASSFLNRYALHKCNSADVSPCGLRRFTRRCPRRFVAVLRHDLQTTPRANSPAGSMEKSGDRWLENPKSDRLISSAYQAWLQGRLHREPGLQVGEDPAFPPDQFYNPPEDELISAQVLSESADERIERREYRYTRIKVVLRRAAEGTWTETSRDLEALRLNPWWFSHDHLYTPANDGTGGPFTIGRVIHSSRGVGFTGWIGGVAVFNRALRAEELAALASVSHAQPLNRADAANR